MRYQIPIAIDRNDMTTIVEKQQQQQQQIVIKPLKVFGGKRVL